MTKYFGYWPTVGELAADFDVQYVTAGSWISRGEIPTKYDLQILMTGEARGFTVSHKALQAWHEACADRRAAIRSGSLAEDAPIIPHPFSSTKCAEQVAAQ